MINSISITNFECFRRASVDGLRPVNIVVGENASGKTAFLEALYVAARGFPNALMFVNQLRGVIPGMPLPGITPEQFAEYWNHFFSDFNTDQAISFEIEDSAFGQHRIRIFYGEDQQVQLSILPQGGAGTTISARPLVFERSSGDNKTQFSAKLNQSGQILLDPATDFGPAAALFGSTLNYPPADNSIWWSQLSLAGQEAEVVAALREEFRAIEDIRLLSPFGPFSTAFYAKSSFTPNAMLPLQLVSSGINKLFTLILGAVSYRNGVILVDEIENGIHYTKYPHIWSVLHRIAKRTNCQVFASTHSREALEAALPALDKDEDDFCLVRVGRTSAGAMLKRFSGNEFRTAVQQEREVR